MNRTNGLVRNGIVTVMPIRMLPPMKAPVEVTATDQLSIRSEN